MTSAQEETILANITPSQVMIAQLAAEFLPKIKLPADWPKMSPHKLAFLVTHDVERFPNAPGLGNVPPFDVMALEAVRRAKTVLLAACGHRSPALRAFHEGDSAFSAELDAQMEEEEKWEKMFPELQEPPTGRNALPVALAKTSKSVRLECFRRWREQVVSEEENKWKTAAGPHLAGILLSEHEALDESLDQPQFVSMVMGLHHYYLENKQALSKAVQSERGKIGGRKSAKLRSAQDATTAAKYGADASGGPDLGKRGKQRLNNAAKKVPLPRKRKPR